MTPTLPSPRGDWETQLSLHEVDAGEQLTVVLESSVFIPAELNAESKDQRELGVAVRTLIVN
jgi:hypothetical protein